MGKRAALATMLVSFMLVITACGSSNESTETSDPTALATQLIDEYVEAVFTRDQEALGNLLSDAYLLRRSDGSGYDRAGYINALAEGSDYELVDYAITGISARQDGDILVAVFTLDADIEENGKPVTSIPSPSVVTFVRVGDTWKLASDAFFSE